MDALHASSSPHYFFFAVFFAAVFFAGVFFMGFSLKLGFEFVEPLLEMRQALQYRSNVHDDTGRSRRVFVASYRAWSHHDRFKARD